MQILPVALMNDGQKTTTVVVFNPASLKDLCDATGEPVQWLVENLCGPFIEDAISQNDKLAQAIANKDAKTLENIAHRLKGSSGSAGAMSLIPYYAKLMEAGRLHNFEGTTEVLRELRIWVEYGRDEVAKMQSANKG